MWNNSIAKIGVENPKSSDYILSCITCRVMFKDVDIQRAHYHTDWHIYNLKRKVAEFPPITAEEFRQRVLAQQSKDSADKGKSTSCKVCRKTFNTQNQYDNHVMSKKHKEKASKIDQTNEPTSSVSSNSDENQQLKAAELSLGDMELDSDDIESVDSDEWHDDTENPVKNNNCLFCNHHSRSYLKNLKHMTEAHSFFIPDPEYCTDIRQLLEYLGEKIFAGYMCLWCNDSGRVFQSADAARAHMISKGHCKMLHEGATLAEYAEFYDYSASYPDAEGADPDADVEIPELDDGDYQLVLPSGSVIGHRSLNRYYRQNLDPNRALAIPKNQKIHRVLSQYRALGWKETQKEVVMKKVRDLKFMQRIQSKYSTQLQFKANKLQTHFRQQVNF